MGVFVRIMEGQVSDAAERKTIVINATYAKVHRTASSLRVKKGGRGRAIGRTKGGLNTKLDGFDASCFDGVYVTGDVTAETIASMNSLRADTAEKIGDDSDVDVSRLALPNPQEA